MLHNHKERFYAKKISSLETAVLAHKRFPVGAFNERVLGHFYYRINCLAVNNSISKFTLEGPLEDLLKDYGAIRGYAI